MEQLSVSIFVDFILFKEVEMHEDQLKEVINE
jgi:hypothetical protein